MTNFMPYDPRLESEVVKNRQLHKDCQGAIFLLVNLIGQEALTMEFFQIEAYTYLHGKREKSRRASGKPQSDFQL